MKTLLYHNDLKKNLYFSRFGNSCKYLIIETPMNDKRSMEIKDAYRVHLFIRLLHGIKCILRM